MNIRLDRRAFIKWLQSKQPNEAVTRLYEYFPHTGPIVAYLCEVSDKKCWAYKNDYYVEGQDAKTMSRWAWKFIDNAECMPYPITAAQALSIMDIV